MAGTQEHPSTSNEVTISMSLSSSKVTEAAPNCPTNLINSALLPAARRECLPELMRSLKDAD
jgi:hypothetical protein